MYTIDDINENIKFIGGVVQTTLNNISLDELTDIAKEDLLLIDNFVVAWEYRYQDYEYNDQLALMNIVMKKYLKYFTLKNRLRTVAYKIKPSKREIIEDNFERVYKSK